MLFLEPRFHVPAGSHRGSLGGGKLLPSRLRASHLTAGSKHVTKQIKERSVWLRAEIQFPMAGKAWWLELGTSGHVAFAVRKQRDACWYSAGSLLCLQSRTALLKPWVVTPPRSHVSDSLRIRYLHYGS